MCVVLLPFQHNPPQSMSAEAIQKYEHIATLARGKKGTNRFNSDSKTNRS